jgi:hypothetical protein
VNSAVVLATETGKLETGKGETRRSTDILRRLRDDGGSRPVVDPGLAGGLRDWLEDALAEVVAASDPEAPPVRVHKGSLNQVLVCEAHLVSSRSATRSITAELARGSLVDALFRQWITTGAVADPVADALDAFDAEGDRDGVAAFVRALDGRRRRELADEVAAHATRLASDWGVPAASWLARTQERLEVPLCGGRVVLAGVLDLVLGSPSHERASVCLVELKSGPRRIEHRGDLHFYTLLETLRSGSPPFRMATYYSATGELDAEPVDENALLSALRRTLEGATRLCRLDAGAEPARTPNALCAWCAGLPSCAPGQARVSEAADAPVARRAPRRRR